jgi:predicted Zn-dependent peptidase
MDDAVQTTVLDNGVRIVTLSMPYLRSVSMGVWVGAGARDETQTQNGLSHLIEHMIFKGTVKRSAYDIAKQFDAIGGHSNAFTSLEHTCFHAKVIDDHLPTMVDILSDIFLNSLFDGDELEKERAVVLQEIGMVEDSPEEYIHVLAGANFWGDHPLGRSILGTRDNLMGFDTGAIRSFFNRLYQPERIVIAAAGNMAHERIVDLAGPVFAPLPPGTWALDRKAPQSRFQVRDHVRDLEQVHLCLTTEGLPTTDPDRFTIALLNTILGGNMSSRLFQEIRERRGLAYSVYSFLSSYVDAGMAGVYAGVDPRQSLKVIDLILDQMEMLARTPVSIPELEDAKQFTIGSLMLAAESNDNQMVRLAQGEINFKRHIRLEEIAAQILAVSPDDLLALAARLFRRDKIALTLLGSVPNRAEVEKRLGQ